MSWLTCCTRARVSCREESTVWSAFESVSQQTLCLVKIEQCQQKKKKNSESALKLVIYSRKSGNAKKKNHIRDTDDQVCCHSYNVVPFL